MKKIWLFLSLFCLFTPNAYAECQSFANPDIMNSTMMEQLRLQANSKKQQIAILPFADLSPTDADPVLSHLMTYALHDLFAARVKGLLHPYLSFAQNSTVAPIEPQDIKASANNLGVRYVLYGSYQKQNGTSLRVLIGIYDRDKDLFLSPQEAFTVPLDDSLLDLLQKHTASALKSMRIAAGTTQTRKLPALGAYRYYSRGMDAAQKYEDGSLKVAAAWLEKALRESHHDFDEAALALARGQFMLALLQKLKHQPFAETFLQAKNTLGHLKNRGDSPRRHFTERFIRAHEFYQKALSHLATGQDKIAAQLAANGLSFVPEDGMLEHIVESAEKILKRKTVSSLKYPICF